MMNNGKWPFASIFTVLTFILIVLLIGLSWLLSVIGEPVRNLLSTEGIRWVFSNASVNFLIEEFSYCLQGVLMLGALKASGLNRALGALVRWPGGTVITYRQRRALIFSGIVALIYICVVLLLILLPHAILLSATGRIYPSPFTEGLVSAMTIGIMLVALIYGTMSNTLRTFFDVTHIMYAGLEYYGIWIIAAIMLAEFYAALQYVFG